MPRLHHGSRGLTGLGMAGAAMVDADKGLLAFEKTLRVPEEQVRFAVVLNGGVSLAVWMGGVVLELDRLTKATRRGTDPYSLMQRLTGCGCRADVISGTSAGGINGAALALTQVNRDADPSLLRDLWIDQGRIESLLRPPFRGQPTSLLQGDEYFLPKLHAAMEILAKDRGWVDASKAPLDLTITTTVLRGNLTVAIDSMGQQLPQALHAGAFRWKRFSGDKEDPFSKEDITRTAHRLALASRSSASFPFAFEPSFVPVSSPMHKEPGESDGLSLEVRLRPDMKGVVESWGTRGDKVDRSRYVIDGGVLANTPTQAALVAIERMPAEGPVRRVMLLVFPHAPEMGVDLPDTPGSPPTVAGAMSGFLGALTAQGSRTYVEALERHNLAAAGRRGTRGDILRCLQSPPHIDLSELSGRLYPQYRRMRRWRAARDLSAWRTGMVAQDARAARDLPPEWSFERVRAAAEAAQDAWLDNWGDLPYAPPELPTATTVQPGFGWGWGVTGALGVTEAVSDLLRRMVWVMQHCDEFEALKTSREKVLLKAHALRESRDLTDKAWREAAALVRLKPDTSYWTLRLACYDHLMLGRVSRDQINDFIKRVAASDTRADGDVAATIAAIGDALAPTLDRRPGGRGGPTSAGRVVRRHLRTVVAELRSALASLHVHLDEVAEMDPELRHWHDLLTENGRVPPIPELLSRLVHLEIAATMLGDEVTTGATLPVELVQISAQTRNPFAIHSRTSADKLGGDAISRFGGFLKRSWRVNDWIWGRADGATVLCRTLLDPARIRRTARLSGYLSTGTPTQLAAHTVDGVLASLGDLSPEVTPEDKEMAIAELAGVFDLRRGECDLPSALPTLAAIFATAVHRQAVPAELPVLAAAVRADRVDGANPRSRGEVFLEEHRDLLTRLDATATAAPARADRTRALAAFDRAGIGREPLREEASSDLVIRTANTAAAVVSTVVDSDRSGLAAAKPVTRALRGGMLVPYWTASGLTSGRAGARSLALLGLALGGVLLALALFSVLPDALNGPAAALGAGAVLAAFAYAALRTGSLLHGVVLLTPLIPLVVFAVTGPGIFGEEDPAGVEGGSTLIAVLAGALGLMLLGSIGFASRSVWATLDRVADAWGWPRASSQPWLAVRRLGTIGWFVLRVVGALAMVAALALGAWWLIDEARIAWIQSAPWWFPALVLAGVAGGGWIAHFMSRRLQVLAARQIEEFAFSPVSHPDAVAAGWSVLYGIVYLLIAWALTLLPGEPQPWQRVGFATAVVFAVALLLVVPIWLPMRAVTAAIRAETTRATTSREAPADLEAEKRQSAYALDLVSRGVSYRTFVAGKQSPGLTDAGKRVEQRVVDARAAVALRALWLTPTEAADRTELVWRLDKWRSGIGSVVSARAGKRVDMLLGALQDGQLEHVQQRYEALVRALERSRGRTGA